ncbi:MAG: pyridoxal phosphate-dependent aminotransferase [Deltaproteobacteria bacterium]|nr:pyridoxal phosphate-dependent aminotransferase [Deltaproteobacteria bacterium]
MTVSKKIKESMASSSWIRRMFEEGAELKARLGPDKVFDFSLGNPDLEPPPEFKEALIAAAMDKSPGLHRYMSNAGLLSVRQALAVCLQQQYGQPFGADDLVLTCGASGGLNVALKAILDPGDEVVIFAPYFPEYFFYVDNHGGIVKVAETDETFDLNLDSLAAALSSRTRAVILNSPNNPTGRVYGPEALQALGKILSSQAADQGRPVYLLADEPYSRLLYDDHTLPNVFAAYPDTLMITSFSKELSIPGERLGFVAVSPKARYRGELIAGLILANRILGFVNAPALMQRAVAQVAGLAVDITPYARRRELFSQVLSQAGIKFFKPQGAFYFFPEAPGGDDLAFVQRLKEEHILAVPGRGFGRAGYFRLAFCVQEQVIEQAASGFIRAARGG